MSTEKNTGEECVCTLSLTKYEAEILDCLLDSRGSFCSDEAEQAADRVVEKVRRMQK